MYLAGWLDQHFTDPCHVHMDRKQERQWTIYKVFSPSINYSKLSCKHIASRTGPSPTFGSEHREQYHLNTHPSLWLKKFKKSRRKRQNSYYDLICCDLDLSTKCRSRHKTNLVLINRLSVWVYFYTTYWRLMVKLLDMGRGSCTKQTTHKKVHPLLHSGICTRYFTALPSWKIHPGTYNIT